MKNFVITSLFYYLKYSNKIEFCQEKLDGFGILQEFHCHHLLLQNSDKGSWPKCNLFPLFYFCCILSLLSLIFSGGNLVSRAEGSGFLEEFRSEFYSQEQPTTVLSGMAMSPPPYITRVSYVIGFPQNIPESVTKGQIISKAIFVFLTSPKKRTKTIWLHIS